MREPHVDPVRLRPARGRVAPVGLALIAACALLGVGCDDDKKKAAESPAREAGATADKYATADPKLAKVLQAKTAAAADDKGPPPTGIFPPGIANARHALGMPTTLEVVSEGSEPRVSLGPAADASPDAPRSSSYGLAALELTMQTGPRTAMPTVDFGLVLGPGKKEEGGADWLVADVKKAMPTREQMAQLPPGIDKEIGALAGASLRLRVTGDGRESDVRAGRTKGEASKLEDLLQSTAESLAFATVPLPEKPLGVGAQWIAETRMPIAGVDAIAYRAYRVREVNGDRVRLSVDAKGYATTKDVKLPGLPPGGELEQFEAQMTGDISLVRGEILARTAQLQEHVAMVFSVPGAGQQGQGGPGAPDQPPGAGMMTAQIQTQTTFARGEDARVTAKQP